MKFFNVLPLVLLSLIFLISCYNQASHNDSEHAEPVGFFLRESGATLVTYQGGVVTGTISVTTGGETGLISVIFIDADGDEFTPVGDDYSLVLEATSTFFDFEQHAEDGKWRFHVLGKATGEGTFILKLFHGEHSDFLSKAIQVSVTAAAN